MDQSNREVLKVAARQFGAAERKCRSLLRYLELATFASDAAVNELLDEAEANANAALARIAGLKR